MTLTITNVSRKRLIKM